MEEHETSKMYKCGVCEKCFHLKWRLKKHEEIHMGNVKTCNFFKNQKDCPYEKIGCKFLHEKAVAEDFNTEHIMDVTEDDTEIENTQCIYFLEPYDCVC